MEMEERRGDRKDAWALLKPGLLLPSARGLSGIRVATRPVEQPLDEKS
jgi:hypothetical protein